PPYVRGLRRSRGLAWSGQTGLAAPVDVTGPNRTFSAVSGRDAGHLATSRTTGRSFSLVSGRPPTSEIAIGQRFDTSEHRVFQKDDNSPLFAPGGPGWLHSY